MLVSAPLGPKGDVPDSEDEVVFLAGSVYRWFHWIWLYLVDGQDKTVPGKCSRRLQESQDGFIGTAQAKWTH